MSFIKEFTPEEQAYAIALNSFGDWVPHDEQKKLGKALFKDKVKMAFVRCGRKFGKTEIAMYILYRIALTTPNAGCYYLAPLLKQAKEIVWASNRIQNFVSPEVITSIDKQDTRIRLYNGSFIKVDGSDNFDSYRGIEPHGLVLDEFREHDPQLLEAMEPNLAVHNAPLVIIGTPPPTRFKEDGTPNHYYEQELRALRRQEQGTGFFLHAPTHSNKHISEEWLEDKKQELLAADREWEWQREYLAKYATGGEGVVFPMFIRDEITKSSQQIQAEIFKDQNSLIWVCAADPGSTSCFAVLFFAINPYTKQVYILDEIYETDRQHTSTDSIMPRVIEKVNQLHPNLAHWLFVYDEAAAWFHNEASRRYSQIGWIPSAKSWNKKENNISLVKDILRLGLLSMSDAVSKFPWEMEGYKIEKEKVVKKWDHLIDAFFYGLSMAAYEITGKEKEKPKPNSRRFYTMEQDRLEHAQETDPSNFDALWGSI